MKKVFYVTLMLLGLAWPVSAQTGSCPAPCVNPRHIEWQQQEDFNIITKWEIGYFLPGASNPVQVVTVPKADILPTTQAAATDYFYPKTGLPRPVMGNFVAQVRAYAPAAGGGEVASVWSTPSDPFSFAPTTSVVRIRP